VRRCRVHGVGLPAASISARGGGLNDSISDLGQRFSEYGSVGAGAFGSDQNGLEVTAGAPRDPVACSADTGTGGRERLLIEHGAGRVEDRVAVGCGVGVDPDHEPLGLRDPHGRDRRIEQFWRWRVLVERDNPVLLAREFFRTTNQMLSLLHALNGRYCSASTYKPSTHCSTSCQSHLPISLPGSDQSSRLPHTKAQQNCARVCPRFG